MTYRARPHNASTNKKSGPSRKHRVSRPPGSYPMSETRDRSEKRYQGVAVSPGIAHCAALVFRPEDEEAPVRHLTDEELPAEIERFEGALIETRAQILELQHQIAEKIGAKDAGIFDAHLLVVEDRTLIDEVLRVLQQQRVNVETAFKTVADRFAKTLGEIDDPYLRERAVDIQDVTRRVVNNLLGRAHRTLASADEPHVLVAHNLTPSDTAQLNRNLVHGFATDIGSKTSHTAIMARSMGIPAVVGMRNLSSELETGDPILIDGYNGLVFVHPSEQTLWEYGQIQVQRKRMTDELEGLRHVSCATRDGRHVILSANIELPDEMDLVVRNGAEGVGLYRTEFLYIQRSGLPAEEEQVAVYREVAERARPHGAIFRTLDLGGDKFASNLDLPNELNPFLGWRAIRFCLEKVDVFKVQLRAILRASTAGNVKLMYPMISGMDEWRQANEILDACRAELRAEGVPFDEAMEVGAMIEVPSAAVIADMLAKEAAFFSIGTNDLIQYSIAVDRLNERTAHLYEPTHPAIVRLLERVVEAGHAHGRWVGVCGEVAGDVVLAPLLVGLGVDELSTGASNVPRMKRAIGRLDSRECAALVNDIKALGSGTDILTRCEEMARALYPELLA